MNDGGLFIIPQSKSLRSLISGFFKISPASSDPTLNNPPDLNVKISLGLGWIKDIVTNFIDNKENASGWENRAPVNCILFSNLAAEIDRLAGHIDQEILL